MTTATAIPTLAERIIVQNTISAKYFSHANPLIVLMGVCGCGKTTVA